MIWFGLVACNRHPVAAHSLCQMLRPDLVAIAFAFCVSGRPDCSPGTCQTLQPYFNCEFNRWGTAGGGSTIATAKCEDTAGDIVVRTNFQLPSYVHNGSEPLFFNRMEALTNLQTVKPSNEEEWFVVQALAYGLNGDRRLVRRWIPRAEILREHRWREYSVWKMRLVFEVASPAAECEFCMHMSVPLYQLSQDGRDYHQLEKPDEFIMQVSVMQQVVAVELGTLPLQDLLQFFVGYVQDLTALAYANIWHDCHIGNVLMQQPEGQDVTFYWHDFAGSSFGNSKPRAEVLKEFIRKMSETIHFTAERLHALDPTLSIPSLCVDISSQGNAEILKGHLREFNADVQRHVLGWSGDLRLRRAVLRSLGKVLSPGRYEELQLELMKGHLAKDGGASVLRLSCFWTEFSSKIQVRPPVKVDFKRSSSCPGTTSPTQNKAVWVAQLQED